LNHSFSVSFSSGKAILLILIPQIFSIVIYFDFG
jgi:hypothetical protein